MTISYMDSKKWKSREHKSHLEIKRKCFIRQLYKCNYVRPRTIKEWYKIGYVMKDQFQKSSNGKYVIQQMKHIWLYDDSPKTEYEWVKNNLWIYDNLMV